jgi:amino acid adenylation domain-containing protein
MTEDHTRRGTQERSAPMSSAQERLWFLDQLDPGSLAYNIPRCFRLRGPLDVTCLEKALNDVVRRQAVLRTVFRQTADGGAVQHIQAPEWLPLVLVPVKGGTSAELIERAAGLARDSSRRPFDLTAGPLLRADLLRLEPDDHVFVLSLHHIVTDHWSLGVLLRELSEFYAAHLSGLHARLPELALDYADYSVWQRDQVTGTVLETQEAYWREQLAGSSATRIPYDHDQASDGVSSGERIRGLLRPEATKRLGVFAESHHASLFMAVTTCLAVLLGHYSGESDVTFGYATANRRLPELVNLVGFFVNTIVLRIDVGGDLTCAELLDRMYEVALDAYENQDVPFEKLVQALRPDRGDGRIPLISVMTSFLNVPMTPLRLPDIEVTDLPIDIGVVKFDIDIIFSPTEQGLVIDLGFRTGRFRRSTVERFLDRLIRVMEAFAEDGAIRMSQLPFLADDEREEILALSAPAPRFPAATECVHELFERQAQRTPDAVVLVDGRRSVCYAELDQWANRVARRLSDNGVGPGDVVAVRAGRSPELAVAALAVLKAGGAYLPLDLRQPEARREFMLSDAGARVMLTAGGADEPVPSHVAEVPIEDLRSETSAPSSPPTVPADPNRIAYIIYTSGSTGQPKGVEVPHRGLANLSVWHNAYFEITGRDRGAWLASVGFDASMWELWPYLIAGASLAIADEETRRDLPELPGWLAAQQVTVCHMTPPEVQAIFAGPQRRELTVRVLLTGGDRLHVRPPADAPFRFFNNYGPTESSVISTVAPVQAEDDGSAPAIGTPIDNVSTYVLDQWGGLVDVGVPGELYIGGAGLAAGYLGRPDLTNERFLPNPFGAGRLYRTGDIVRWNRKHSLEFIGRRDAQVKVRGYRVELAEIEIALRRLPGVRQAVAVAHETADGGKRLTAYVVGDRPENADLNVLRAQLPEYMIPSVIVPLSELPLNVNGKVDRNQFPELAAQETAADDRTAPADETESRLASMWVEILGVKSVGRQDNFFELGGHSLNATTLASRIRDEFSVSVRVRTIFNHPTLSALAEQVVKAT